MRWLWIILIILVALIVIGWVVRVFVGLLAILAVAALVLFAWGMLTRRRIG